MVLTSSLFDAGTLISLCLIVVFRIVIMLSLPLFFIGSLYSCMWLMQIYRSARRTRSSGLSLEYLVGTTLGRLFFACCECSSRFSSSMWEGNADAEAKQKITGFLPKDDGMKHAFTGADVIVIPAGIPRTSTATH